MPTGFGVSWSRPIACSRNSVRASSASAVPCISSGARPTWRSRDSRAAARPNILAASPICRIGSREKPTLTKSVAAGSGPVAPHSPPGVLLLRLSRARGLLGGARRAARSLLQPGPAESSSCRTKPSGNLPRRTTCSLNSCRPPTKPQRIWPAGIEAHWSAATRGAARLDQSPDPVCHNPPFDEARRWDSLAALGTTSRGRCWWLGSSSGRCEGHVSQRTNLS